MITSRAIQDLKEQVTELLSLAEKTKSQHKGNPGCIQSQPYALLHSSVRMLVSRLGNSSIETSSLNEGMPRPNEETIDAVFRLVGLLKAIEQALDRGWLTRIESIVTADILSDFLEQAEVLLNAGYHLPAAVLLRAILEERLRKLCETNNCVPTNAKPTIESFKQNLYAKGIIDKIVQKKIDWMAGVGNAAAHNLPEFRPDDAQTLYKDTLDFLERFAV